MMSTATLAAPGTSHGQTQFRRNLQLVRISALRALKVRYRGSALGVIWSLTNPVMLTAVYTAIFGTAFSAFYGGSVVRYVMSAFVGLVVVTFFLNATSDALGSVVQNGSLLNKVAIPPVIFPLSAVAANVFQQALTTFPIVFVASILITHDPLRALLVPVVLVAVVLLSTGFGLALAALFVFFRDLPYLWQIVGFILWMTSPLFYPPEVAPLTVRPWFRWNPVAQDMSALRDVVFGSGPVHFHVIALGLGVGAAALVLGALFFRGARREFMDLL